MHLEHRATAFSQIISTTICTNNSNEVMPLEATMQTVMAQLRQIRSQKQRLYLVGNGGSAAVASHAQVDFVNVAKICAQVLHEPSLVTCMANDFGYEQAFARVLIQFILPGDILIAISSSGQSSNICNAAIAAKDQGAYVVTLTGFKANNKLRALGDINIWLDSSDYGYVEVGHQFILHNLSDRFGIERQASLPKEILTDIPVYV